MNIGFDNIQFGYSFRIMQDGSLDNGQEYVHYHLSHGQAFPGVSGLLVDTANLLYSATNLGIQISDQLGRVNLIISKPAGTVTDIKMGGEDFSVLYAICDGKLFRRKLNTRGTQSWLSPVKPSRPRM
jgi:gluconolactonase